MLRVVGQCVPLPPLEWSEPLLAWVRLTDADDAFDASLIGEATKLADVLSRAPVNAAETGTGAAPDAQGEPHPKDRRARVPKASGDRSRGDERLRSKAARCSQAREGEGRPRAELARA